MCIEFVQTMSMGPSIKSLNHTLWTLGMMCAVDLSDLIDMKNGAYWHMVQLFLCLAFLYFALFAMVRLKLNARFDNYYFFHVASSVSMVLLPIVGNVLFMPFIGILSSVFICYETSGDDIGDAFLDKDCYVTCWEGEHLYYLILSAIVLVIYGPLSMYMRPQW